MTSSGKGFHGSTTSRAEVVVYPHRDHAVLGKRPPTIQFRGRSPDEPEASLVACSDSHTMGDPASFGEFEIKRNRETDIINQIADGDWADISYSVNGRVYHTLRGPIRGVHRNRSVRPNGATSESYTVQVSGFGTCLEEPIWFNQHAGEYAPASATKAFALHGQLIGPPNTVTRAAMTGFLGELNNAGRATWELPPGVPNRAGGPLIESLAFLDGGFTNLPARVATGLQLVDPTGNTLWGLMRSFADLPVCELFPSLVAGPRLAPMGPDQAESRASTRMAIIHRDRPFPLIPHSELTTGTKTGIESPWFKLPLFEVYPQGISSDSIGRSWSDHSNVFIATPDYSAELGVGFAWLFETPLLNPDDVRRFGVRLMDVSTRYLPQGNKNGVRDLVTDMRRKLQQWHCLNRYFLSGQIRLNHARPDIRIGSRFRIKERSAEDDTTYYVEHVSNRWTFNSGVKTEIGVTRGWKGDDASLLQAITRESKKFVDATLHT